jgi:DNA-binding CsgD family transcriptional regulator
MQNGRSGKHTLVRRLALAKLRELRALGMSYREIGRRYGGAAYPRVPPGRILAGGAGEDASVFLRALDALDQGLAFFDSARAVLHLNAPLQELLDQDSPAGNLRAELINFADSLWRLTRLRCLEEREAVEELATQEVPRDRESILMKGSYIGIDLFGRGPCVLVALDRPPHDPLSPDSLRTRFGLSNQECRIAQLLAEGRSNADIADQVLLSPHTIRRHTERILSKLSVRSRAEAVARMLRVQDP